MKTADDLFKEFKILSVSEFFKKNADMLGYMGKLRSMTVLVHETVTNALDACEEANILPKIRVEIERKGNSHYLISVEDNATGIPLKFIPKVFGKMLAGSKAHRNIQSRGQQGIGVSGAVMYSQVTTGQPATIISSTGKEAWKVKMNVDVQKNRGKILEKEKIEKINEWRGTKIIIEAKDVRYNRSRYSPCHYLKMSSIANPHMEIEFIEPDGRKIIFPRTSKEIPESPRIMKLHPKGFSTNELLLMAKNSKSRKLRSFLRSKLARVSRNKTKKIEEISGVSMNKKTKNLKWEDAEKIVDAFKKIDFMAPSSDGLIPIGEENIEKGISLINPEFTTAVTRSPKTYKGGFPFIVEIGLAYGGKSEPGIELIRYANRSPLIFDRGGGAINEAVKSIDWKRYGVNTDKTPLTVFVNVTSTHIPYTSAGKQAIAMEEEIYDETRYGIMEACRHLKRFLSSKRKAYRRKRRKKSLTRYALETSRALSKLTGEEIDTVKNFFVKIIDKKYSEEDHDKNREKTN
ncbi:MAG: DNA topoisomerase VI subunit B [Euryarchaeota archaeon]|nr:DNA topoisomerase VI subunit B [Euryarchaeota archaeon]